VPVSVLGVDPLAFPQTSGLEFAEGDESAYAELARGRAAIVNPVFATTAGVRLGDRLELLTPDGKQAYHVVALGTDFMNAKVATAYISQANLAADFHRTEDVFIQLNLAPGADADAVEKRLREIAAEYPQFQLVSGRAYIEEAERVFTGGFTALYALLGVLAVPSLIAMLNTLAIGVIERTREIGMLRAIGSTQKQVRRIVIAEALLLASAGTLFGLLAGLYLSYVLVMGLQAAGFPVEYIFPLGGEPSPWACCSACWPPSSPRGRRPGWRSCRR
jgi:putative ABC transport system permease protein